VKRALVVAVGTALAVQGCAAPYDGDGEVAFTAGQPARPVSATATSVVVDTDLGGDDLAALAFLLRHPDVSVEAITVAGGGLVGCDPGVDIVADLLTALGEPAVPVACGSAPGEGMEFPDEWRELAETGTGIPRTTSTLEPEAGDAAALIARLTRQHDDLVLVALGPMTTAADLVESEPKAAGRLAGIHAMGGSVEGVPVDGVAEWNAAADPAAFGSVLAAGVPLTVVPEDAVPTGTPDVLSGAPVVGRVAATVSYPAWWDLATAAALVAADETVLETGEWLLDDEVPGRLFRTGEGDVQVVRSLDEQELDSAYAEAFG
jgi:hypothetical protein